MSNPIAYTNVTHDDWVMAEPEPESYVVSDAGGEDFTLTHDLEVYVKAPGTFFRGRYDAHGRRGSNLRFVLDEVGTFVSVPARSIQDVWEA